ncbi:PAS domain S-box protein [Pengzhenrongella frigida]|uniref:Sensor domain-containing diguanylate cyclase n=1 Tax=Pengzhenrongella frigida TaxID=1259133 RepID=A0A4Q5N3J6_9MICO|nr:PAS domain S-box protein [Cellulomonas sp. HLT2-17]RYV52809.1 sensor domain-containing diguanylate cyclase [Cellulomonas sp. HLT2-17]
MAATDRPDQEQSATLRGDVDADLYRVLVENSMDVMIHTVAGVVQWVSPAVTGMLGWAPHELVGRTTAHLWHPDDREAASALRDQVYAGRPGRGVFRLRTRDGRYLWVESSMQPFTNELGTVGAVGSMRDLTAQIESENARLRSEERFRLLTENATIGMCLESADGRFLLVNPAMCQMLGRDTERMLSSTWQELTHPDDVAVGEGLFADVAAGRIPSFHLRKRYLKPDGSVLWGDLSVSCVRNDDMTVQYFIAQIVDVTDRVRVEKALADSERHYRSLVEGASEALLEVGPDHHATWISPAIKGVLGWAPEELVGTVLSDLVHPEDRERTEAQRTGVFHGKDVFQRGDVMRMRTNSGTYRWVIGRARPVFDAAGTLLGVVGGVQDIDELMAARLRLQATLDTEFDPHVLLEVVRDEARQIADFVFVEVNPAACDYLGMSREELVGARLLDVQPGHLHSGILEMFRRVMETGEPLRVEDFAYEQELMGGAQRRYDFQAVRTDNGVSSTWRDVTDRHAMVEALAVSEEMHRLLAENLSDVVVHLRDGVVKWVTPSLTSTLGWSQEDWLSRQIADFVHEDDRTSCEAGLYTGDDNLFRARIQAVDLSHHWVQVHTRRFFDQDGAQNGIVASLRIIDAEVAAEAELETRARFDQLTGLLNRHEVLERVATVISHPRRTGIEAAVLFCDIDGFKNINDEYGHACGDTVLHTVADRVTSCLRSGDLAARIGGDELLVLLDGVHDLADAATIAEKIRRAVAQPIHTDAATVTATMSIGVTLAVPGENVDETIARADKVMYQAKRGGGDRVIGT